MRVVLDTNILVSALMLETGHPAAIYRALQACWRISAGNFFELSIVMLVNSGRGAAFRTARRGPRQPALGAGRRASILGHAGP